MIRLTLFVSSPGDVGAERSIALRVAKTLSHELRGRVALETYLWQQDALKATDDYQSQIPRVDETDVAIFIVWSRLGSPLDPGKFRRADGSPYQSGTEYEFEQARASHARTGRPEILFYRKTDKGSFDVTASAALKQAEMLIAFLDREFRNPDGTWRGALHFFAKPEEFETLLESHLRRVVEARLDGSPREGRAWKESPYRGLRAFEFEDAALYCGRTAIVTQVAEILRARAEEDLPFLMIQGMSGSGKSSLVRAGLLPLLSSPRTIERVSAWRRAVFRPADDPRGPLASFADALASGPALPELLQSGANPEALVSDPEALVREVLRALDAATLTERNRTPDSDPAAKARLIVVIDQFEELFGESVTQHVRDTLASSMAALLKSGSVWGVATMRSDFAEVTTRLPEAFRDYLRGTGRYTLGGPRAPEIAEIIRRPAKLNGYAFQRDSLSEYGLDDILCRDAAGQPAILPLLEFTLDELCKRAEESDGVLKIADYEALGGLSAAIGRRAQEEFGKLSPEARAALPALLAHLIHIEPKDENVFAKSSIPRSDVADIPGGRELIDAFVNARLMVVDKGPDDMPTVGLAHEALLRAWQPISGWIESNLRLLRQRAAVSVAAARWNRHDEGPDYLIEGQLLREGRELAARRPKVLSPYDEKFVVASTRHTRRRRSVFAIQLLLAFAVVGVTVVYVDAIVSSTKVLGAYAGLPSDAKGPSLSTTASANLERGIATLSSHLEARMATFTRPLAAGAPDIGAKTADDSSLVPWVVAQASVALAGTPGARDLSGPSVRRFMDEKKVPTCNCWAEVSGNLEHRMATAWVLSSLATLKQPAHSSEIKAILDAQNPRGWWSMFPAKDDARNASTSATAWMLYALHQHAASGLVKESDKEQVCRALNAGYEWLKANPARTSHTQWKEYPLEQTFEFKHEYLAPSAFAIHVLNQVKHDPYLLVKWLDELPLPPPDLATYDWAKAHVVLPNGTVTLDEVRHYRYPWMLITTAEAFPAGTRWQRARATVWIEEALREPVVIADQCSATDTALCIPRHADWTIAEVLIALRHLKQRVNGQGPGKPDAEVCAPKSRVAG
jgi:hypothetical protein